MLGPMSPYAPRLRTPREVEAFLAAARHGLHASPSDWVFDSMLGRSVRESEARDDPRLVEDLLLDRALRPAAVLVPVVAHETPTVLLTQRPQHMPTHAGQIAFPGGKIEPGDRDAVAAAIREAEEEIGLAAHHIETIGFLDALRTHTGFHVTPVVALVSPGFELALDASEVSDAFEVPLGFLMDTANHQRRARERDGRVREFYAMPYGERFIWGATAAMIKNMQMRLYPQ